MKEGVGMKRWLIVSIGMTAAALLASGYASGAEAHSQRAGFVAQPVIGSIQQPTSSSYFFRGTATWEGVIDNQPAVAVYRCVADGPVRGAFDTTAQLRGSFGCWAEGAIDGAPESFHTQVRGTVANGKATLTGLLREGLPLTCEGFVGPASNGIRNSVLGCTVG